MSRWKKYKFNMFEHNWRGWEHGKCEEVCMLECKMDVGVENCILNINALNISFEILMMYKSRGRI
jgi:hypothetical protein